MWVEGFQLTFKTKTSNTLIVLKAAQGAMVPRVFHALFYGFGLGLCLLFWFNQFLQLAFILFQLFFPTEYAFHVPLASKMSVHGNDPRTNKIVAYRTTVCSIRQLH